MWSLRNIRTNLLNTIITSLSPIDQEQGMENGSINTNITIRNEDVITHPISIA